MSKSPLSVYKEVVKEFEVEDSQNVSPTGKMTYVQEQLAQQKAVINRLLFDIATARFHMAEATDPQVKDAHRKKSDDFVGDLRSLLGAAKVNIKLIEELRKEYPELAVEE